MANGVRFEVKVFTGGTRRLFERIRALGIDPVGLLDIIGSVLESSARNRIANTNKGPDGVPWPISQRVKRQGGGKTLYDRGNLLGSLRYEVQAPSRVIIGVDGNSESAKNAASLQFGSHRQTVVVRHTRTISSAFGVPFPEPHNVTVRGHGRKTNLPARPFLGVDAQDRADIREAAKDYLREELK